MNTNLASACFIKNASACFIKEKAAGQRPTMPLPLSNLLQSVK
jgi:hypothetical protein